ncbi:MAG: ribokinase [Pseudomonadota bacterium]
MIINFGSINVDYSYRVSQMPKPGETVQAKSFDRFLGGKGANQSVAISKSGGRLQHIGIVGNDGDWAVSKFAEYGVDTSRVIKVDMPTGHANIMVDDAGENVIVIVNGANHGFTHEIIESTLEDLDDGNQHWVLLQNETNLTEDIVSSACGMGYKIVYSAAPFVAEKTLPLLPFIDLLVVNDIEAATLAQNLNVHVPDIPVPALLVTKGEKGACYFNNDGEIEQEAFSVPVLDTTGAGDCYLGAFLAMLDLGQPLSEALKFASAAAAIQVSRRGTAEAIPDRNEVYSFLAGLKR